MTPATLVIGESYNFQYHSARLKYLGKKGNWHQFERVGEQGVWAEVLDEDLHMIEKTEDSNGH